MFGIGTEELVLILVIALVVLGPERMPKLARDLGRMVGDFRRTSDELRNEFLNADRIIDVAAKSASTPPAIASAEATSPAEAPNDAGAPATPIDVGVPLNAESVLQPGETAPATEADVATVPPVPPEPDETTFDREAREARERLQDPARARQAAAEGWKTPSDEAGTTDRWG
jgi:sec-independent protein translocase protein TatB